MKYSEFKSEVEKMGLFLDAGEHGIEIVDKYGREYAYSSKESEMIVDTAYENFPKLPQEQRAGLFDLLYEMAKTPIAEREVEKCYHLKLNIPICTKVKTPHYLIKNKKSNLMFIGKAYEYDFHNPIFTESEISKMDITGFEKIEVDSLNKGDKA